MEHVHDACNNHLASGQDIIIVKEKLNCTILDHLLLVLTTLKRKTNISLNIT